MLSICIIISQQVLIDKGWYEVAGGCSPLMCSGCPFVESQRIIAFSPNRYYCQLTSEAVLIAEHFEELYYRECFQDSELVIQQANKRIDWYNTAIERRLDLESRRKVLADTLTENPEPAKAKAVG
jgi:hypothetical protein